MSYVPSTTQISYEPIVNSLPITDAEGKCIAVSVVDNRREGKNVSRKKDGYGIELASIKMEGELSEEIKKAVKLELSHMGFVTDGDANATIGIEIHKFYNDFKPGVLTNRGVAELMMSVLVTHKDGNIVYSKNIIGIGEHDKIWVQSGKNAGRALEAALNDAIHKLIKDPAFVQTLKK